ncbi:MAG: C69 family dipeptidase [Lachnospiraceae bacterium]|nr:C69 family dipeptidase [Lachnospiraceae bacterium]
MSCTTILAGKKATFDGSTFMARNEDSGAGNFMPKKFIVVKPEEQPRLYRSVISGVEIPLPDDPVRYTAVPNAVPVCGIWGEAGINEYNVAMSETETLTSNPRVMGADPLVKEGIGEEDLLTITLPYIRSAREGVKRLGELHEKYGTYEMNGVGFQDADEVWWFETIGGHHWMAKRVPDDAYAVIANQLGIDFLDLKDAFGTQKDNMCSEDLITFIRDNHLDLTMAEGDPVPLEENTAFDTRSAFGSHDDFDHSYNTPRTWYAFRYMNPKTFYWDGPDADYSPESDDIPWCLVPEKKITVEDVKYALSSHYQSTPFDPYRRYGDLQETGKYRPIGVNRTNFLALTQLRPYTKKGTAGIQWIAMGSNITNAFVPFYTNVDTTPSYFADTDGQVTTGSFYWANRITGALADPYLSDCAAHVERYQKKVAAVALKMINEYDAASKGKKDLKKYLAKCNQCISDMVEKETNDLLGKVLYEASMKMKNGYSRSDA